MGIQQRRLLPPLFTLFKQEAFFFHFLLFLNKDEKFAGVRRARRSEKEVVMNPVLTGVPR